MVWETVCFWLQMLLLCESARVRKCIKTHLPESLEILIEWLQSSYIFLIEKV